MLTINGGNVDGTVSGAGNYYAMDGNSALLTVNAGNGDDWFQVGQLYSTSAFAGGDTLPGDVGRLPGDALTTVLTTEPAGYLSDGIDKTTVLNGGAGTDTFQVYSNKADLNMNGGSGDDTFIVRAFLVAAGTNIGVQGGSGTNTIEYNLDAPITIKGGTGFNTLIIIGTAADDVFVITKDGIYGAGVNVSFTGIQALTIDGVEGDDTFYVLGTQAGMVTTLDGGPGGDTFIVGGDVPPGIVVSGSTPVTFDPQPHTLANSGALDGIDGPLYINGGGSVNIPLAEAITLPYETNNTAVSDAGLVGQKASVPEVDNLRIYDDGATGQTGLVTTIAAGDVFGGLGDNIGGVTASGEAVGGLDLPSSASSPISSKSGTTYEGGINWLNLDAVNVFLGGNDNFTIDTTAATVNADDNLPTMLVVEGGGGSNTITVQASSDPLVLYGAESATGGEYNSPRAPTLANPPTGNALAITGFGSETINAAGATGTAVIVGGPDGDTITGGSGVNWIAGAGGNDTITASGTQNYIFANSAFTVGEVETIYGFQFVDLASRFLTIDNGTTAMNGGVLSAGNDTITVTGGGSSDVLGAYGVIDIAGQSTGVVDPFSSLGAEVITTIASVNFALGGNDTITVGNNDVVIGGAGANNIYVGSVGADVIFGANGEADYLNGVLTSAESLGPTYGGVDTIEGLNGAFAGSGNSVVIGGPARI